MNMKRIKQLLNAVFVLIIVASFSCGYAENIDSSIESRYTLVQLREDYQQLQDTLEKYHPMAFTDKEELGSLLRSRYQLIQDNMGVLEFYRILSPIVAAIRCGHTNLYLPKNYLDTVGSIQDYFPLDVKVINDQIFLYQDFFQTGIPKGSEITKINDKPASVIIDSLLANLTADGTNQTRKYALMNLSFNDDYFFFIDHPQTFQISYREPNGKKSVKAIKAVSRDDFYRELGLSNTVNKRIQRVYSAKVFDDYATLTLRSFYFITEGDRAAYEGLIDEFFEEVQAKKITKIIIDLRDNGGGNPYCAAYLLSYLISRPTPFFSERTPYYADLTKPLNPVKVPFNGHLIILTNGGAFSTTGHFCALLKYHGIGTFVGEETGGSYLCTSGCQNIALKNTGIILCYATKRFRVEVEGLTSGRGILPDYPVSPSIGDYLEERDLPKEFAVHLIHE